MQVPALIVVHELRTLFRTRRVLALLALYLGIGVLGGFGYVKIVQLGREAGTELAVSQGATEAEAEAALSRAGDPMREKIVALAAGASEEGEVAESLAKSLVLPVFFWCSLAFLPLLVLLTSFDHVASELATRSMRFSCLRASRAELLFGKTAAHLLLFCGLSAVCSLSLLGMAGALLDDFVFVDNLPGLLRVWVLLVPYAACYLAISTFASCTTTRPLFALLLALAITVFLRVLGAIGSMVPETSTASALRALRYASPAHYHSGLWLAELTPPMLSSLAYCLFAAMFMAMGHGILTRRDL